MPPPKRPPEKPKNIFGTLKRAFSFLSESKIPLVVFFSCVLITAASNVLGGYMLRPIIDDGIAPLVDDPKNKDLMANFIWLIAPVVICRFGLSGAVVDDFELGMKQALFQ